MKKLENQLQNHITESSKRAEVSEAKMDDLSRKIDLLMERLLPHTAGILGSAPGENHQNDGQGNRHRMVVEQQ